MVFAPRDDIPWDRIRALWEAGGHTYRTLSIHMRGEGCPVSHEAIRKRAMTEGWKDSGLKPVRQKIERAIKEQAEPRAVTVVTPIPEPEVMRALHGEALKSIEIVRQHRTAIAKDIVRLDGVTACLDLMLADDLPKTGLQIDGALEALERLSRIRERLIRLERQAFGLSDEVQSEHVAGITLTVEQKESLRAAVAVRFRQRAPVIEGDAE